MALLCLAQESVSPHKFDLWIFGTNVYLVYYNRVIHNDNIAKAILSCFFLLKIFTPWVVPASLGRTAGEMIYLSVIHKGNIGWLIRADWLSQSTFGWLTSRSTKPRKARFALDHHGPNDQETTLRARPVIHKWFSLDRILDRIWLIIILTFDWPLRRTIDQSCLSRNQFIDCS